MARRKRAKGDDSGADAWLGTYGDMITLLMAFFVMLYAISQVDEKKFLLLVSGLDVFGNTGQGEGLLEAGDGLLDQASGSDGTADSKPQAPSKIVVQQPEQVGEFEQLRAERAASEEQVDRVDAQLDKALERVGLPGSLTSVRADPRGVVISVSSDDVLFALGSTDLSDLGARLIRAIATVLRRYDEEVVVEGHTDNLPLRRPGYSNWNLSTDRAVVVVERLHHRHGIDQRRLVASGYGQFRPLVPNTSNANRARNRRVDVLLRLNEE